MSDLRDTKPMGAVAFLNLFPEDPPIAGQSWVVGAVRCVGVFREVGPMPV